MKNKQIGFDLKDVVLYKWGNQRFKHNDFRIRKDAAESLTDAELEFLTRNCMHNSLLFGDCDDRNRILRESERRCY